MNQKVLLVLVDGMRPDAIDACTHPFLRALRPISSYCMHSKTVMPSVTLPCHCSLFFSVDPARHGILTNTWVPQVRPIDSLGDTMASNRKRACMFYNWEQLRDLNKPGSLYRSEYMSMQDGGLESDRALTERAIYSLKNDNPDFIFLYLGHTDNAGHADGWMSENYRKAVSNASACIEKIFHELPKDWSMVITADHGGHERSHGCDIPEDMTIPIYFTGDPFEKGKELDTVSIKDLAPTIAKIMGLIQPQEWEGHSVI